MSVKLVTRVDLADGVQLQLDTAKYDLDVDQLRAIQEAVGKVLKQGQQDRSRNGSARLSKGDRS